MTARKINCRRIKAQTLEVTDIERALRRSDVTFAWGTGVSCTPGTIPTMKLYDHGYATRSGTIYKLLQLSINSTGLSGLTITGTGAASFVVTLTGLEGSIVTAVHGSVTSNYGEMWVATRNDPGSIKFVTRTPAADPLEVVSAVHGVYGNVFFEIQLS